MIIPLFLTLNNFVHDFAAAMWVASIVVIYFLRKKVQGVQREVSVSLLELARLFRAVLVTSVVVIFLTGVGRTIFYNYFREQTAIHTFAVVGKHIILMLLAVLSFAYVWKVIGKWQNELEKPI